MKVLFRTAAAALLVSVAGPALAQETLNVFWVKGFYKSEDDALFEAMRKFEQKTGVKVALSQYRRPGHDPEDRGGAGFRHRRPMSPTPTSTISR